ncbi:hypothetical protein AEH57_02555 [Lactococcus garvieae]|nr:hypothetical protein AEH57_02555 [Lactococcus garvieae]
MIYVKDTTFNKGVFLCFLERINLKPIYWDLSKKLGKYQSFHRNKLYVVSLLTRKRRKDVEN